MMQMSAHYETTMITHWFVPSAALNSGHYTAYSRHPVTGNWHYYNDETVTEVSR